MNENFQKAVDFVLAREGGYSNDPDDPGGETNFGICKRSFPDVDIKALTRDEAISLYRKHYWEKASCDFMPWPMDVIVFDTAVLHGPGYANQVYKMASAPVDILFSRLRRYSDIIRTRPTSIKYLRGWTNRVIELYNFTKGIT